MKDLRDEIALGASGEDLFEYQYKYDEFSCPVPYRTRAEARYAYADAMMAARGKVIGAFYMKLSMMTRKPIG